MIKIVSHTLRYSFKLTLSLLKVISIVFVMTFSNTSFADESKAQALLDKMSNALRTLNYQGRFMYVVGGEMSSFQIEHAIIKGKEHERLVFLNHKQQEVVRVGHDVFCIHPGNYLLRQHEEVSTNPFADKLSKFNKGIYENYQVILENNHIVAGRITNKIIFKSKDNNRYDHALWIDQESNLLLKADVSDPTLGALESFEYVQIEIGKEIPVSVFSHKNYLQHTPKHFEPESLLHTENGKEKIENNTENTVNNVVSIGNHQWRTSWVPDGFIYSGKTQHTLKADAVNKENQSVDMLMYTDGLAAITIFIETIDKVSRFNESSQKGAVSVYSSSYSPSSSTSVKMPQQNFMITVIGEVQLKTLERIAKGVYLHNLSQP